MHVNFDKGLKETYNINFDKGLKGSKNIFVISDEGFSESFNKC